MRLILCLLLAICMASTLAGCTENNDITALYEPEYHDAVLPPTAEYRRISASEARLIMETEYDFILLDVRTHAEFAEAHIEGALLIPVDEIMSLAPDLLPNTAQIILIYCRSGQRSRNAALALLDMGHTAVYDFGGIISWPYGTVSGILDQELAEPTAMFPFTAPKVEYPDKDEMIMLLADFSGDSFSSEFQNLDDLDISKM